MLATRMEEEAVTKRLKAIQALMLSNSALRCLLTMKCRRSAGEPHPKLFEEEPVPELSRRYEQLIEAVKLLQEDLLLERKKSELRCCRQFYSDIARLVLFIAGSLVALAIFHPAVMCTVKLCFVFSSK
ncbi:uncharacterized protein [Physcomitrium patens]|uniref:Uncharacterized protein n=1 Tax=Physcomitrium patens TaxID=3218 RepID=A0A2K1JIN1_PHYPA|nr:uncharacterized protein LOC112291262 [Physcomitrium patens]PNR41415.1 hypothetical protein PHYPA_018818 [Physcomitrium patens]|eukprot:XP_024394191.1 uncharacterized protein LOC112291262 [Physcomitrella patens]